MKVIVFLLASLGWVATASAFDWGGSVENTLFYLKNTTSDPQTKALTDVSTVSEEPLVHLWASWSFGQGTGLLLKGNLNDTYALGYGGGNTMTNTFSGDLDYLVYSSSWLWVGRTDFREFSGTVLNTKLDGVQAVFTWPLVEMKAAAGTSAAIFKSGNTITISEDDTKDRQVLQNLGNPSTLWAPPRLVADVEATSRGWISDQTFHAALLGQLDLRPGEAKDGDQANTNLAARKGASVSTAYLGTGGEGRIVGPVYWNAWAYLEGGTSLTAVGPTTKVTNPDKTISTFQVWKSSYLLGGIGNLDVSFLKPDWHFLYLDLGVQVGSWDPDGATPNQNNATSTTSTTPTLYTGWVGISQTSTALIFNPQPVNMVITQLLASVKPLDPLQLISSTALFVRPTPAAITETGVIATKNDLYLGIEADLSAVWRPTSDFGGTLALGIFAPNTSVLTRTTEVKIQTTANLSF